ncbi:galactose-binding domain-like protein [Baffinella frigidus]|nr:galactose-binding domain-like protein [Cryptophyta sp. CCMP2293]
MREVVSFFHDDDGHHSSGGVSLIALRGEALTDGAIQGITGCTPAVEVEKNCKSLVTFNVPYSGHSYSSVYAGDRIGTRYGRGRLDSGESLIFPNGNSGNWMQLDSGKVQSIAGLVVQGRSNANQYVTSFTLEASTDGKKWASVECGRRFTGNTDATSKLRVEFKKAISARYLKISVSTFYSHPCIRAALLVCESPCTTGELDYEFDSTFASSTGGPNLEAAWGVGSYDVGSKTYRFQNDKGLQVDESSCVKDGEEYSVYMDVRFNDVSNQRAIFTSEKWYENGLYAVDGFLSMKPSPLVCHGEKLRNGIWYKIGLTRDKDTKTVSLYLNGYLCATGTPRTKKGFTLDPTNLIFFRGPNSMSSSGRT